MDEERKAELLLVADAVAEKFDKRLEGRFTRVHERIDPMVEDIGKIKGKLESFPTQQEIDEKIHAAVASCREGHDEKDKIKSEISKRDWLKIIVMAVVVLLAAVFGVRIF